MKVSWNDLPPGIRNQLKYSPEVWDAIQEENIGNWKINDYSMYIPAVEVNDDGRITKIYLEVREQRTTEIDIKMG